jgi:hypothetical protein
MRTFDWKDLLLRHGIPFAERGANVKRNEINIRCPFCGSADPSQHMGLNLETGWWSCWRNRAGHSGKSPLRLLVKLLDVPYWKARELAGLSKDYIDPDGFDAVAAMLLKREPKAERPEQVQRRALYFDREFLEVSDRPRTRRFWNYLFTRHFAEHDITGLCHDYDLRCATDGWFSSRLIIPYLMEGELVAWTGRDITGTSDVRYKDLPRKDCLIPPKETLLGFDGLAEGGKALVIVEGPLDYLKVDFYGREHGVRAVALSTNSISQEQCYQLEAAVGRFDRFFVMADTASAIDIVDSMRIMQELAFLPGVRAMPTPYKRKDAGDLRPSEARTWATQL